MLPRRSAHQGLLVELSKGRNNKMALNTKAAPEFDIDEEVLLMEPDIDLDEADDKAATAKVATRSKAKQPNGSKQHKYCLLYTSPSPRDRQKSRMPSSA